MPESLPQLCRQMCICRCYTSRSALCFSSFCSCFHTHLQFRDMLACCFMPTDSKNEWRWQDLFSNSFKQSSCRNSPWKTLNMPQSTPVYFHMTVEWGLSCFPWRTDIAWLSSAAQARHSCHPLPFMGDWKGVTVHKSPSITPSLYTAQSRFHLQSAAICVSLLHSLPCPSSHHRLVPETAVRKPRARNLTASSLLAAQGSPQHTANSLPLWCSSASSQVGTVM